jgi:hypothetical protein
VIIRERGSKGAREQGSKGARELDIEDVATHPFRGERGKDGARMQCAFPPIRKQREWMGHGRVCGVRHEKLKAKG